MPHERDDTAEYRIGKDQSADIGMFLQPISEGRSPVGVRGVDLWYTKGERHRPGGHAEIIFWCGEICTANTHFAERSQGLFPLGHDPNFDRLPISAIA